MMSQPLECGFDLKTLHEFRDGGYRNYPGLSHWWKLAQRNIPGVVYEVLRNRELREPTRQLMDHMPKLVRDLNAKVSDDLLENAVKLTEGLKEATRNRRLAIDCSRARAILPHLRGKTGHEALQLLATMQPARHPIVSGNPRIRISKSAQAKD